MITYTGEYSADTPHNKKVTRVHASTSKTKTKKSHYRLRKWVFGSSIVLVLFLIFFWQPVSDSSAVIFSSASSDIKQAGRDAGLNMHGQAIFLSNDPEFADAATPRCLSARQRNN